MIPKLILFSDVLLAKVEAERGDVPFSVFVRRAVEARLGLPEEPRQREGLPEALYDSPEPPAHLLLDSVAEVVKVALRNPPLHYPDAAPAIPEAALSGSLPPMGAKRKAAPRKRSSEDRDCMHPVSRRLGSACGICGETVR